MDIKKSALVYFSPTGNSQKVVRAISEGTGYDAEEYNLTCSYKAVAVPKFGNKDLVIVGAPVYVGRVPSVAAEMFKALKGNDTPCVIVGTYGNRHYDDYLVELEDLMHQQGFLPVAAAAFTAEHSFSQKLAGGRPDENDLAIAKDFGEKIREKLVVAQEAPVLASGAIPGGRPYRAPFVNIKDAPPIAPEVGDMCIDCKKCAQVCPTGAINLQNVREIAPQICIRCRACAHVCPVSAIDISSESFWAHTKILEDKFGSIDFEPLLVL